MVKLNLSTRWIVEHVWWQVFSRTLREPIKEKFNGIINQLFDDEQVKDFTNSSKDQIEKLIDES